MLSLEIEVTSDDIALGCISRGKARAENCPVAHAAQRAGKLHGLTFDVAKAWAGGVAFYRRTEADGDVEVLSLGVPHNVRQFVNDFDNNKVVKPFTFVATSRGLGL